MASFRILAIIASACALYFGSPIFIPLFLGYFLFVLLDPLVTIAARRGVNRTLTSVILVSASMVVFVLATWTLYGIFSNLVKEIPVYSARIESMVKTVETKTHAWEQSTSQIVPETKPPDDVQKVQVVQGHSVLASFAFRGINTLFEAILTAAYIPLLAFFLLLNKEKFQLLIPKAISSSFNMKKLNSDIVKMIRGFFIGNLIIGFGMSLLLGTLYCILGLNNWLALGLMTGFLNLIPYLGVLASLVLPSIGALLQFNTFTPLLIITISVVVLHFVVADFVIPKVVGSHVALNAIAATVGLLFWGWLWGALGLLLAVPLTAILKIAMENHKDWVAVGELLSE